MRFPGRARGREFALFTASTLLYQAARFAFSLAAAWALLPNDFTAWALVVAILIYAPSLLLGVANGMSRQLPLLVGRGDEAAAERSVQAAWTATAAAAGTLMAVAAVIAAAAPSVAPPSILVGTLAAGTIAFGTQQFILRSRLRFDAASWHQASFGVLVLVGAVVLALRGAGAADFRTAAALYAAALLVAIVIGIGLAAPPRPRLDIDELIRLARVGFPIMLAGLVFSLFVTLDRWIAVTLFGPVRAAPYALASLIAAALLVMPTVVSHQTYPRMAMARGHGAGADELRRMARGQGRLALMFVAPVAMFTALFAWLGIPILLPNYTAAAPAVVVLSAGLLVLGYLAGYGNYLNVVGGQWRYLAVQVMGVLSSLALMFVLGRSSGLVGIALGMSLGHLVYGVTLRAVAVRTPILSDEPLAGRPVA